MTQPKRKQQRSRFKTAVAVAAVGLFGATIGVVVAADKSAAPNDQFVAVNDSASTQSSFSSTNSLAPTPTAIPQTTRPSTTTTTQRRSIVIPFPNARSRAS